MPTRVKVPCRLDGSGTHGLLLVVLGIALTGCQQHAQMVASPKPPPAVDRPTLAVFPAAPYTYELSIEHGKDPAQDQPGDPVPWRFQVRLVRDGRVLGQVSPFAMACGDAEPVSVDRVFGADPEARAWATSVEHCEIDLAVRPVELAPGITALLATQRAGYEAIYPLHWLIGARNGRLEVLWESPAGPDYFTRARVLPTADPHRNELAFIEVFTPSGGETETIKAMRLSFDPLTGEVKKNINLRYPNYSGTLVTAGGLVFVALMDGTVAAYDDTTLDEVWKINVGSGFAAPPMTFEVNGKQYIAIASGPSGAAKSKLINSPELKEQRHAMVLYVFGL